MLDIEISILFLGKEGQTCGIASAGFQDLHFVRLCRRIFTSLWSLRSSLIQPRKDVWKSEGWLVVVNRFLFRFMDDPDKRNEVQRKLGNLPLKKKLMSREFFKITEEEVAILFELLDFDKSGTLSPDELQAPPGLHIQN